MARKPDPRLTTRHRRRLRQQVLQEETVCWLCGEPVDKTTPRHQDGAPEVDEIQPRSLGGNPLDRNNLRLAHRICNQQRSNAPPPTTNHTRPW